MEEETAKTGCPSFESPFWWPARNGVEQQHWGKVVVKDNLAPPKQPPDDVPKKRSMYDTQTSINKVTGAADLYSLKNDSAERPYKMRLQRDVDLVTAGLDTVDYSNFVGCQAVYTVTQLDGASNPAAAPTEETAPNQDICTAAESHSSKNGTPKNQSSNTPHNGKRNGNFKTILEPEDYNFPEANARREEAGRAVWQNEVKPIVKVKSDYLFFTVVNRVDAEQFTGTHFIKASVDKNGNGSASITDGL